jgi:hypothetical protein
MTEPLLALQVKQFDPVSFGDIMQQRDAYRTQQNAMMQQQQQRQQNAMLQTIYRRNVDASGNVNQQGIIRDMAQAGIPGIPAQMEALGKAQEATGKGSSEQFKHAQEILAVSRNELGNARTPQDAMAAGMRIAQQYPEAADSIRQTLTELQNMAPEQFGAWKMDALRKNLTAAQQLQQHYQAQNLGGSARVLSMPMYGAGAATVVPGSEAQVTMTPQQQYAAQNPTGKVVQDANGNYFTVDPRTGTAKPVTMGGGGGGIPGARGGGDFGTFKSAVVQTESHGDYTALSPKGALGAYQVMPATAKTLAGRLGLPWNPELMRSNTPEGRQYQDAIGDAAAQEAWQASGGDPARAAAYYHGGSDTSKWGPKTQAYAQSVVANMGRAPAAAPAAGGGQLQGPTKGKPAATAAASSSPAIQDIDAQISRLDELYNHKGLEYITGSVHGRMGSLNALPGFDVGGYHIGGGGQEADNAQALLETIQANATLGELQKLKQSGTTLGQIAVYEDKMLGKAAANLKQAQDKATFQKALREYKARLLEVKKLLVRASIPETAVKHLRDNPNLKNAFDSKYGAGMAASVLGGR